MTKPILAAAACALLAPSVTSAQLLIGAQAGLALPAGKVEPGLALKDEVALAVPLELRVAWRVAPRIAVGLQGGYAFASEGKARKQECETTGVACKGHLWRIAARGEYAFDGMEWRPLAAATLGWEWLVERWEMASDNWDQQTWGGPVASLELGVERSLARRVTGGAFLTAAVAQYRAQSVKGETAGYAYADSAGVVSPAAHAWFGVGLRITFEPIAPDEAKAPAAGATGAPESR